MSERYTLGSLPLRREAANTGRLTLNMDNTFVKQFHKRLGDVLKKMDLDKHEECRLVIHTEEGRLNFDMHIEK